MNKQFIAGLAFNRRWFHTNIDACIMVALWSNEDADLDYFQIDGYDYDPKSDELVGVGMLDVKRVLKRLKGKKRLIVGNCDGSWMGKVDLNRYFTSMDLYLEISDDAHALTLCHYPMLTCKHARRSYMIHGHIHADTKRGRRH